MQRRGFRRGIVGFGGTAAGLKAPALHLIPKASRVRNFQFALAVSGLKLLI